ncbi:hypothetical protein [Demequina sp.]|uniref:hypothetical protein n=1 Tax=Demequina sp. TaxID=2050685 RepID=UPI0025BDFE1C|nr:hypothetical protein [Demequina sp.]
MSLEQTRNDVTRLRAEFIREPRDHALHLAQRLSWYSMQLALDNQQAESEATWTEALEVAEHVLTGPEPSQFERTELIRIGVGTARCMVEAGRPEEALEVLAKAEQQYQLLAAAAAEPMTVLAVRGTILTGLAHAHHALGDADSELESLVEAALELASGSDTNPLIVRSMLGPPLSKLHTLLEQGNAETG